MACLAFSLASLAHLPGTNVFLPAHIETWRSSISWVNLRSHLSLVFCDVLVLMVRWANSQKLEVYPWRGLSYPSMFWCFIAVLIIVLMPGRLYFWWEGMFRATVSLSSKECNISGSVFIFFCSSNMLYKRSPLSLTEFSSFHCSMWAVVSLEELHLGHWSVWCCCWLNICAFMGIHWWKSLAMLTRLWTGFAFK